MFGVTRTGGAGGLVLALAACSDSSAGAPRATVPPSAGPLPAAVPAPAPTTVRTPAGLDAAPFDRKRELSAPPGWQVAVWARVPGARLLAWTPDDRLLVSRPSAGDVVSISPSG